MNNWSCRETSIKQEMKWVIYSGWTLIQYIFYLSTIVTAIGLHIPCNSTYWNDGYFYPRGQTMRTIRPEWKLRIWIGRETRVTFQSCKGTDAQISYFSFVLNRKRMADHSILDPSVGVPMMVSFKHPSKTIHSWKLTTKRDICSHCTQRYILYFSYALLFLFVNETE